MKIKYVLLGIMTLLLLTSCAKEESNGVKVIGSDGYFIIGETGERYCALDYTHVTFYNKDEYVLESGWPMNMGYYDNEIIIPPEANIGFCEGLDEMSGECINKSEIELTLPCVPCVDITEDYTIVERGMSCLNDDEIFAISRYLNWVKEQ